MSVTGIIKPRAFTIRLKKAQFHHNSRTFNIEDNPLEQKYLGRYVNVGVFKVRMCKVGMCNLYHPHNLFMPLP